MLQHRSGSLSPYSPHASTDRKPINTIVDTLIPRCRGARASAFYPEQHPPPRMANVSRWGSSTTWFDASNDVQRLYFEFDEVGTKHSKPPHYRYGSRGPPLHLPGSRFGNTLAGFSVGACCKDGKTEIRAKGLSISFTVVVRLLACQSLQAQDRCNCLRRSLARLDRIFLEARQALRLHGAMWSEFNKLLLLHRYLATSFIQSCNTVMGFASYRAVGEAALSPNREANPVICKLLLC